MPQHSFAGGKTWQYFKVETAMVKSAFTAPFSKPFVALTPLGISTDTTIQSLEFTALQTDLNGSPISP